MATLVEVPVPIDERWLIYFDEPSPKSFSIVELMGGKRQISAQALARARKRTELIKAKRKELAKSLPPDTRTRSRLQLTGPIKIFLFERNERDIILPWIKHHAQIIGLRNITIIDHQSTDGTFEALRPYQNKGLTLVRYRGPYTNKGKVSTQYMAAQRSNSSLLIPMDADEFIVTHRDGKISTDPEHIRQDLIKLKPQLKGRAFFNTIYNLVNVDMKASLSDLCWFEPERYTRQPGQSFRSLPKSLFSSATFVSTDMGNHYGTVSGGHDDITCDKLALMHYQVRGLAHFVSKTKKSNTAFGYDSNRPVLHIGKHWKKDHDCMRQQGPVEAFKQKYLQPKTDKLIRCVLLADLLAGLRRPTPHVIPDENNTVCEK